MGLDLSAQNLLGLIRGRVIDEYELITGDSISLGAEYST